MALTKEDMMRELELLPVWRQRQPAAIDTPIEDGAVAEPLAQQVETVQAVEKSTETPHVKEAPVVDKAKVQMPWVLVFQVADDQAQAGRTLVQNIVKAMRLPANEYVVLSKKEEVANYQAEHVILFGQSIVDAVLDEAKAPIESLSGQPIQSGTTDTQFWATESIDAMLATPSLKAKVWQDLRKILAATA